MRDECERFSFDRASGRLPLSSTLVTESLDEKTRHPAIVLALSEKGGNFSSRKEVVPGEAVGILLHPDLRYAIRGRVTWTRRTRDDVNISFGVAFEQEIPESLWGILGQTVAA